MEAKFTLYSNKTKKFTFKATAGGKAVTDITAGDDSKQVAEGRVRVIVFSDGTNYYIRAEGNLGAQQFGVEKPKVNSLWNEEGRVEAIRGTKLNWQVVNRSIPLK